VNFNMEGQQVRRHLGTTPVLEPEVSAATGNDALDDIDVPFGKYFGESIRTMMRDTRYVFWLTGTRPGYETASRHYPFWPYFYAALNDRQRRAMNDTRRKAAREGIRQAHYHLLAAEYEYQDAMGEPPPPRPTQADADEFAAREAEWRSI
jgi:predicted N-acyltransferase